MKQHNCINRSPKLKTAPLLLGTNRYQYIIHAKIYSHPFFSSKKIHIAFVSWCVPSSNPKHRPFLVTPLQPLGPMLKRTWDAAVQSVGPALSPRKGSQPYPSPGGSFCKRMGRGNGCFKGWVFNGWPKFGFYLMCVTGCRVFYFIFSEKVTIKIRFISSRWPIILID